MAVGSRSYQHLQQPRVTVLSTMVVVMLWLAVAGFPPTTGWLAMTHGRVSTHGSALPCLTHVTHHLLFDAADCKGRIYVWQAYIALFGWYSSVQEDCISFIERGSHQAATCAGCG